VCACVSLLVCVCACMHGGKFSHSTKVKFLLVSCMRPLVCPQAASDNALHTFNMHDRERARVGEIVHEREKGCGSVRVPVWGREWGWEQEKEEVQERILLVCRVRECLRACGHPHTLRHCWSLPRQINWDEVLNQFNAFTFAEIRSRSCPAKLVPRSVLRQWKTIASKQVSKQASKANSQISKSKAKKSKAEEPIEAIVNGRPRWRHSVVTKRLRGKNKLIG